MLPSWLSLLSTAFHGDDPASLHAGDAAAEQLAARDGTILVPLVHLAPMHFAGEDTTAFLQGQLSSDVSRVSSTQAQLSSYSTPKGRMLASFLLLQDGEGHVLLPSADIRDAVLKRLSMFIMRSKVKASAPAMALLGLAGPQAESLLQQQFGSVPQGDFSVASAGTTRIVRVPHLGFVICTPEAEVAAIWQGLSGGATPAGPVAWQWREIQAGIVRITGSTQELFVPQMANFDLTGAVSFTKGCYPGQEIVARTQYLGKLKKRAYLAHAEGSAALAAGQSLYSPDLGEQATGQIANVAPAPGGGHDLLAIIHSSSVEHGVHLDSSSGPLLQMLPLPYSL